MAHCSIVGLTVSFQQIQRMHLNATLQTVGLRANVRSFSYFSRILTERAELHCMHMNVLFFISHHSSKSSFRIAAARCSSICVFILFSLWTRIRKPLSLFVMCIFVWLLEMCIRNDRTSNKHNAANALYSFLVFNLISIWNCSKNHLSHKTKLGGIDAAIFILFSRLSDRLLWYRWNVPCVCFAHPLATFNVFCINSYNNVALQVVQFDWAIHFKTVPFEVRKSDSKIGATRKLYVR